MYRSKGFFRYLKSYPVVNGIIIVNIFFYIATILSSRVIFESMAGVNILIANGEWWRLITPIFIHTNFSHLLFNCFAIYLFGSILEIKMKRATFLLIYISSGVFANIITYQFGSLTLVHVGSSGAVFGILGVIAVLIYFKQLTLEQTRTLSVVILLAIILSFLQKDTNVLSHIGGFAWGLICGLLLVRKRW
ncbi:rhomboid family intramembrane serine protease [Caldibacillus lycopersici]|uniref:Rhomboid family intramembrane serine protease n=1 Tax=Perspicuibacillus lycopersici TaxID=1325689 RepID=A0AAE3IV45_9BACI|nr:rhomboid family intramembrane serine protease [Perspicuibacillus lycopersici]MCU9615158.1 rhomboid family intramembrane serine protease [Perspicuibacillus lycopersici]